MRRTFSKKCENRLNKIPFTHSYYLLPAKTDLPAIDLLRDADYSSRADYSNENLLGDTPSTADGRFISECRIGLKGNYHHLCHACFLVKRLLIKYKSRERKADDFFSWLEFSFFYWLQQSGAVLVGWLVVGCRISN